MIGCEKYLELRERYDAFHDWLESRNYKSYHVSEEPVEHRISNDEITQIEVFEWHLFKPEVYFLYIDEKDKFATTWTGVYLGKVLGNLSARKDRIGITVFGSNGVIYHGMYYKSSGDYARIYAYKDQAKARKEFGYVNPCATT